MEEYRDVDIESIKKVYDRMCDLCYPGSKSVMFCNFCGKIDYWETNQQNFGSCITCNTIFCQDCGVVNDWKSCKNSYCEVCVPSKCSQPGCGRDNREEIVYDIKCHNGSCDYTVRICDNCTKGKNNVICNDCNQPITINYYGCGHVMDVDMDIDMDVDSEHCFCCDNEKDCDCMKGG